jgi:aldose 1-epimerase
MASHEVVADRVDGVDGVVLRSHDHDLEVGFAPGVGMVGYSLRHRGEELLGQRGGLVAYRERASTFGIPLLHPWANRLAGLEYSVGGRRVALDPARSPVHLDPNGLPIHGVLAACPHWRVVDDPGAGEGRAALVARLDYDAHPELAAAFPFPHELQVQAELAEDTLSIATTLLPTGDVEVPLAFGWHPYLRLPGVPRAEWWVELPVRTRAVLDELGLPTGRKEPAAIEPGPLGERTYDDLFTALADPALFALEGGGRRIEMEFGEGYPVAQVFAPDGQSAEHFICFEPMTAPTNALISHDGLRMVAPGASFRGEFHIRVVDRGGRAA